MESSGNLKSAGTWRRYKLGQAQFTSWLKRTAEKLSPRTDNKANEDATALAPPQQSQSRRQKKRAAAIHVADNAEPDEIPDAAINILRDVVGLRKKSFNFFTSAAQDADDNKLKQSNENHAHIIRVLERVLAKLEALVSNASGREPKNQSGGQARINTSDLTNMFAHLQVQPAPDSADEDSGALSNDDSKVAKSGMRPQKGAKKTATKKTAKPDRKSSKAPAKKKGKGSWIDKVSFGTTSMDDDQEEDEFDLYMMIYCFFEDFNAIRSYVAERWCDYWYDRSVPLDTLAVVTNAAFELFHLLEMDLVKTLKPLGSKLSNFGFMLNMLFINFGLEHIDYESYEELTEDEQNERIWRDEADWLAFTSYSTLQMVRTEFPPRKVPMFPPSMLEPIVYGANDVKAWRDFQSSITKTIICEGAHLKALKTNLQEPPILPAESELLVDFQNFLRTYEITAALTFSLHLWVDIRFIMETDVICPFEQLQSTAARLKEALESHNPSSISKNRGLKKEWLTRAKETNHYMLEDFAFMDKKARSLQKGIDEDPETFALMKNEPVWTGLLDFPAKLVHSQMGHQFVMLAPAVEAAAYVYHAALLAEPGLPEWLAMRQFVETHVDSSQFRTGLREPSEPAALLKKFEDVLASRPETETGLDTGDGGRLFTSAIGIRKSLYNRYAQEERDNHYFMEYLEELTMHRLQIERSVWEQRENRGMLVGSMDEPSDSAHPNGSIGGKALVRRSTATASLDDDKERGLQRRAAMSQLSPLEMLQLLDGTVTSQLEGLLTLDYFGLFDASVALLKATNDALGPEMQRRVGYEGGGQFTNLCRLPLYLSEDLASPAYKEKELSIVDVLVKVCKAQLAKLEKGKDEAASTA
ncbi:hypothetical protein B0T26DRAFT_753398 [Lasiosphaeria miniovina]|uniref:DUF6604 domain-containing protein n=1 Tax=Lasiosphaeria miniovina TaxID=1954250 RepID=A0AA40ACH5_9PEZI|nr:uncharacterized protein B0T26DRAFT_753398 [Lasiosphaeria miniovina]KAK0713267.1 hypothetical protein B0T26DRAFT_753398 [Lasiosphaeria miniovina]